MSTPGDRLFARIAAAGAASWAAAIAIAMFSLSGAAQKGALLGLGSAGATGLFAMVLLRRSILRPLPSLLKAIVTAFLTRIVVIALGLVAAIRVWSTDAALPFTVAFFALFFLLQGLEFAYAHAAQKAQGPART